MLTNKEISYKKIPANWDSSGESEAVNYRVALARASNAIEGVALTEEDKLFMDNLSDEVTWDEFGHLVKAHLKIK